MGFYDDRPPRHGHRTPAELAEDEVLSVVHGDFCGMPARPEETGPTSRNGCLVSERVSVLPWADAHPLASSRPEEVIGGTRRKKTSATASLPGRFRHLLRPGRPFKLLLAIELDDNGRAAIRVAQALTARGAVPTVIHAVEPMVSQPESVDSIVSLADSVLGEEFHEAQVRALRMLISTTTGKDQTWHVRSVTGDPALCIVADAQSEQPELLVIGIHRHGRFEQAMGENTATRVMSRMTVPIMGVRPTSSGLARKIMVATDFGDASREAAHLAANLADPGGHVILVHASLPSPVVEEGDEGSALVQREGIEHAFLHLKEEVREGKSIQVETVSRTGDAGAQLLAAAELISPDLIAMASHRHHLLTRILLGSVTRRVVREGSWPMLITPPDDRK